MAKQKNLSYDSTYASYWEAQPVDVDANLTDVGGSSFGTSRVSLAFTRTPPAGLREDRAVTSIWVAKVVGGGLFTKIPVAEFSAMETKLDTFVTAAMARVHPTWICVEYAWHQYDASLPRDETGKGQKAGPAARVVVKNIPGASAGTRIPDQNANTITLRTVSRRHWGRSYWPPFTADQYVGATGRPGSTAVDVLANAFNTLHDGWQTDGYQIGTWSQFRWAFLTPKQIESDDSPDIIRRRRPKQTNYRKIIS